MSLFVAFLAKTCFHVTEVSVFRSVTNTQCPELYTVDNILDMDDLPKTREHVSTYSAPHGWTDSEIHQHLQDVLGPTTSVVEEFQHMICNCQEDAVPCH